MRFLVDNNIGPGVAKGMRCFGEDVDHLRKHFREDAPDPEWLAEAGRRGWCVLTRDDRIRSRPNELAAVKQHAVGLFVLAGKNRTRCEIIQQLIRNWPQIKEHARNHSRPFVFKVPPKGAKLVKLLLKK